MSATERVLQLEQQLHYYRNEQQSIVANVYAVIQQTIQASFAGM